MQISIGLPKKGGSNWVDVMAASEGYLGLLAESPRSVFNLVNDASLLLVQSSLQVSCSVYSTHFILCGKLARSSSCRYLRP